MREPTLAALWAVMLMLTACRQSGPEGTGSASVLAAPDLGAVVARVGGQPIHAGEVTAQARRTGASPRQALDQLVTLELLAARARQRGLRDPGPPEPSLLVQRLLERDFDGRTRPQDIPDDELRKAYEKVKSHYVHPRMVEVGLLSIYTGPKMKPEPRARAAETARLLEQHLARNPPRTFEDFAKLPQEAPWSERRVSHWRLWQGPTQQHGPFGGKVPEAIHRLRKPGERSGRIDDESGHHFAWYLSEKAPRNVSFEEAREEVRAKYHSAWRQRKFLELAEQAGAPHKIEAYPDRLFVATSGP